MPTSMQHTLHKIVSEHCILLCSKHEQMAGDGLVLQNPVPFSFCASMVKWPQVSLLILKKQKIVLYKKNLKLIKKQNQCPFKQNRACSIVMVREFCGAQVCCLAGAFPGPSPGMGEAPLQHSLTLPAGSCVQQGFACLARHKLSKPWSLCSG